jgi:hypothetical protein
MPSRPLRVFALSTGLLLSGLQGQVLAQAAPAASPKLLVKAGLRLNHLFYLPDGRNWQLVLPASLGLEYRLKPRFSLYAQAEADVSAGRRPRGRRGALTLPTSSTSLSLGGRYYFNQPIANGLPHKDAEPWGNYVALEFSTDLASTARRGRRGRSLTPGQGTPAVFALCGTQHRGPGRRLLYDLNAGLGIEAPSYAAEPKAPRAWDVAAQVNLRVCLVNQRPKSKPLLKQ